MRLYLDASTIIYSIESASPLRDAALAHIAEAERNAESLILTSRLSCLECRVKPLRESNADLLERYDKFFALGFLRIVEIGAAVVERATKLRAQYGLRTPDAIHAATAIEAHADRFLTGDREFARCGELSVIVL
jgi:predicted nucleic acid-binding protein